MNLVALVTGHRARITPIADNHYLLVVTGVTSVPHAFGLFRDLNISSSSKYSSSGSKLSYVVEEMHARYELDQDDINRICRQIETLVLKRDIMTRIKMEDRLLQIREAENSDDQFDMIDENGEVVTRVRSRQPYRKI